MSSNENSSQTRASSCLSRVLVRTCLVLLLAPMALGFSRCTESEQMALDDLNRRGVIIYYTLTHRCGNIIYSGNPNQPGPVSQRAGPYAVYTIDSIDNQRPEAISFEFQASKLFAPPSEQSRDIRTGGRITVAPGATWTTGGRLIVKLNPSDSPFPNPGNGLRYERQSGDPPAFTIARHAPGGLIQRDSCRMEDLPTLPDFP